MKQVYVATFAIAFSMFAFSGIVLTTPTAEAACSAQGLISSGGKCAKSFKFLDTRRNDRFDDVYESRIDSLQAYMDRLIALIELLEDLRDGRSTNDDGDFDVVTRSARNIDDDSAVLRGRLDLGDIDEAEVWFEYGESSNDLDEDTSKITRDEDDNSDFSRTISGLDEDSTYYFRAIAESEDGDIEKGAILRFRTDGDNNGNDEPTANTDDADDVTNDSAELNGEVDMNDFNNGRVFFVYGEDESEVEDIADDYDTFTDINDDDTLMKVSVDSDLDDSESYSETVEDLEEDTEYFYSICVEFENNAEDDELICGDTERFVTDES